jgi:NAD(P)H dehydrogenase (quinone)
MKKFLIIYAHPNPDSFNNAIKTRVINTLERVNTLYNVIDLYSENYNPVISLNEMLGEVSLETKRYQQLITESTNIIFIFPVFWFRAPAILEGFLDKVFIPGFAYRFKQIIGKYGIPVPLLKDKNVLTILTHGAPALPVKTIYINAVKYRFLLGFLSFCFNLFKCKILQLWSVPFVNANIREKYLNKVEQIILRQNQ